jgi:hypothetical protein
LRLLVVFDYDQEANKDYEKNVVHLAYAGRAYPIVHTAGPDR